MNVNNITAPKEATPFETKIPVSVPNKVDAPEKIDSRESENNRQAARVKEEQKTDFSARKATELAKQMNEIMDDLQTRLGFSVREDLHNQVIVEITDRETNELIKQIPSEELLAIKEKMEEFSGLLFDQKI
ncbi:MAG: flagellar protein FlaG [Desulfobacteraceae bacterium]|nr:flagellar protein FlaG [Desulfobacteraceae bacterium]